MKHSSQKDKSRFWSEAGQGIMEYMIIIFLVGIAVVAIVVVMEPVIANVFSELVDDAPVAPPALLAYTPPATYTPVNTVPVPPGPGTATWTASPTTTPPTATPTGTSTSTPTATFTPFGYFNCEYQEVSGTVVVEGEHVANQQGGSGAAAGHYWYATNSYGGRMAMQAQPNSGVDTGAGTNGPTVNFFVRIVTAGDYYMYVRGWPGDSGTAGNNDSVHAGTGGSAVTGSSGWSGWTSNAYTWRRWGTPVHLDPGQRVFTVWMKEDGMVIDRVMLSTNGSLIADGDTQVGPTESNAPAGCTGAQIPTATHTPTPTRTPSPTHTPTPTFTPTPSNTPTPSATPTPSTLTLWSASAQDGFITESGFNTNVGGTTDSSSNTFSIGDTSGRQELKGVLSFDTSGIPDGATIISVQLQVQRQGVQGSPNTLGAITVDVAPASGFSNNTSLQAADYQATAAAVAVTTLPFPNSNNSWTSGYFNAAGLAAINKTGTTQLRITFPTNTNNNTSNDILRFNSGNASGTSSDPVLIIVYQP